MAQDVVHCANCGGRGHVYRNCNQPITSCGVVCYRVVGGGAPEYLMVQRKDSLCYIEFLRGKYSIKNRGYIVKLLGNMTPRERRSLLACTFDELWRELWQLADHNMYVREYTEARDKFETLRRGYYVRPRATGSPTVSEEDVDGAVFFSLADAISGSRSCLSDSEWGFPKGRRNINEGDVQCALREFSEETGVPSSAISVRSAKPYEETFIGSNRVRYRHCYFLAHLARPASEPCVDPANTVQAKEIKDVRWFAYEDALERIRPENVERRELLKRIHAAVVRSVADA